MPEISGQGDIQRSAKRCGGLLSYRQAEPGGESTQSRKHLLAEPCSSEPKIKKCLFTLPLSRETTTSITATADAILRLEKATSNKLELQIPPLTTTERQCWICPMVSALPSHKEYVLRGHPHSRLLLESRLNLLREWARTRGGGEGGSRRSRRFQC